MKYSKKIILMHFIGFVAFALWIISSQIGMRFVFNPMTPNPTTGEVIPYETKGKIFYLTKDEERRYHFLLYSSFVLGAFYVASYALLRRKKNS